MSPAKKNSASNTDSKSSRPRFGWFTGATGTIVLCIVLIGIFIACAYAAWIKISPRVLTSPEYFVGPGQIEVTPPPQWLHRADLPTEIFRDLTRQGPLSIMDDNLTERVYDAFSRHPWVAKVKHVSKHHPALVKVDLIYRKPVCMVEISGGLMPIDVEATLLPRNDFSPVEAAKYPRLVGVDQGPMRGVGSRWGDARVAGAAEIANELIPLWEILKLQYIIPRADTQFNAGTAVQPGMPLRTNDYSFDIISGKMRILWGHSPGANQPGEPDAAQKIKKLEQFYAEHGSLEYPQGPLELDLRH